MNYNKLFVIKCLVILFSVFLASCDGDRVEEAGEKVFYDLKGFTEAQITLLDSLKPQVYKTVSMGTEQNVVRSEDVNWEKELGLFVQADINKPAFKQSYSIARPDSSTFVYTSKEGDRLPVRELKIVIDTVGNLSSAEAYVKSENKLYVSEKHITLSVKNNRIQQYRIVGFQQLIMMDKKPFSINATISN
ncbi:hypothetical protein DSL64_10980 [Dyadobacter luteus]|jgi:hypothetical protein|uniref:LPS export ABC transporter periplasmic protein LptC n=1 Tax=Dyadobacter luteus TaxID=2259619 RepID=A0A3D8YDI0_9BACT|nr:hypothetical protein [Dyadobacter luteus]REA62168.1 hypothetical protein DSL64_10980 [Dyadobacter luteus]